MEKGKGAVNEVTSALKILQLKPTPKSNPSTMFSSLLYQSEKKSKPRKLVSLCIGFLGQNLEDIISDISDISAAFPPEIKLAIMAIARRRKILNDEVLIALLDPSWKLLDVSGSDNITDYGLMKIAKICTNLIAIDISRCEKITANGVSEIIQNCPSLETLRCGGCSRSDFTIRRCLSLFKPNLNSVEQDSWEELDCTAIGNGAQSLRWLIWPKIDEDSKSILATECPRIIVNPKPSPIGFHGMHKVPIEAITEIPLDHLIVEDIDPKTWAFSVSSSAIARRNVIPVSSDKITEIPLAERFRLAFVERDARLAPKRAKNERQRRRREEREYLMRDTDAKSVALASQASKFIRKS